MYQLLTGPFLWASFIIFIAGLAIRTVIYIRGLDWKLDRVTYTENVSFGVKGAIRSVLFWLFPYGSRSWRVNPVTTLLVFVFHIGLVITPIFLSAHNLLLKERWGLSLWRIPDGMADFLTISVMLTAIFLILRRISFPEVRNITSLYDYLLMAISVAPFVTGFMAYHQVSDYQFWLIAHIISGEIMLIAIPLTKLSHLVLFFLSRAQLGMDYGVKRGGMKGKGICW